MTIESNLAQNLTKIWSLAINTFGSESAAESWLNQHHVLLGSRPIAAAASSSELVEVEKILSAIGYGGTI